MDADAYGIGFHVALADHEHGVDFHLFGALNFAVNLIGRFILKKATFERFLS